MLDDDLETRTSTEQAALEKKVLPYFQEFDQFQPDELAEVLQLLRTVHVQYLLGGLGQLSASYASLDASRPWICYWILHSLALLDAKLPAKPTAKDVVNFLSCCQCPEGGYGGGPMQMAHLAPTYAAVSALVTLGTDAALKSINRAKIFEFLKDMCIPEDKGGGFAIHKGGEGDLRACYIAMALAHILCLDKQELIQRSHMLQYVKRCQTYEGGLGGEPGNEAHGGYTYCGLAAVALAGHMDALDLPRLIRWAVQRQGSLEGGFNGRTNKLVDGCYSFWQGGLFPLLQRLAPHRLIAATTGMSPSGPSEVAAGNFETFCPEVPPLPSTLEIRNPVEQAQILQSTKANWAQQIVTQALQASDAADEAMAHGATARATAGMSRQARVLLNQAAEAQGIAEQAHQNVTLASSSAALLYPAPDPTDPPPPLTPGPDGHPIPNPPLFNYKALQLWILRCCQQSKGGLRDKPGKPADYYHTCYCLSGLSCAQHCSNVPLGPSENLLRRTDPMCNIVEDKLKAAQTFFSQNPL